MNDIDKHLAECLFQNRKCPFRKRSCVDCSWSGTLSDIPVHIKPKHYSETAEVQGHFKVTLPYLSRGRRNHQAVLILGELFYLTWETGFNPFSFGVYNFGPKEETEAFNTALNLVILKNMLQ